jgi:release factor glutamine methyltransferase
MSAEAAERIRRWHERSYRAAREEGADGQVFEYLGRRIAVPPDVQPITGMAHLLGRAVLDEVRAGDRVLDRWRAWSATASPSSTSHTG